MSQEVVTVERVTGIGGFFFRSDDAEALERWYAENLGIPPAPAAEGDDSWQQEAGPTVFAPMRRDSPTLARAAGGWMLNLRVSDLDAMVAQLRAAGVEVTVDPTDYGYGRFADLLDPEGNPVQLWQPADQPTVG